MQLKKPMKHIGTGINYYKAAIGGIYIYCGICIYQRRVIKRYRCIADMQTSATAGCIRTMASAIELWSTKVPSTAMLATTPAESLRKNKPPPCAISRLPAQTNL